MAELELSARSSFEMDLLVSDPQIISLSDAEMNKIKVGEEIVSLQFTHP